MQARLILGLAIVLAAGQLAVADVTFTSKPTVSADGDRLKIEFAVSGPTDVEVAILGDTGGVVRHLAAGAVGAEKAASPLKASSLSQSSAWDRKDDDGKEVVGKTTVR